MFERYTEKARRVIFFARYEASQYGSSYIETEHLLLGLVREDRALTVKLLGNVNAEASIREEIERHITKRERISTSVEVPLSRDSKQVLHLAGQEAEKLGHRHVGPEHLLLGMLGVEGSLAFEILRKRNVKAAEVREWAAKTFGLESSQSREERVQTGMVPRKPALGRLESFLAGLKWNKSEELVTYFTENAQFVDVQGKRWNLEELSKEFESLFAPYAKKNATYFIEETLADRSDLLVVIVLWKNAILASMERVWMHRMSVVLVPGGDDWAILLAQVTPVQPK